MDLSFTLIGDVMTGGVFSQDYENLKENYLPDEIRQWFDSDIVFANLECVASNAGKPIENKIVTYCYPETLEVLTDLNVDVVNIANNHQMDYGIEASEKTQLLLDEKGIKYAGAGRTLNEAKEPAIIKCKGKQIAFLCFSLTHEFYEPVPAATDSTPGVCPYSLEYVIQCLNNIKKEKKPDFIVVSIHWGEGKSHNVRPEYVKEAHAIIDSGADMIIGHHAHCLQGYEIYNGKPIFYGLGNFLCSPYLRLPNKQLTYDSIGEYRYRFLRERKTIVVRVNYKNGIPCIEYLPVLQLDMPPILTVASNKLSRKIKKQMETLSKRLKSKNYAKWNFRFFRRVDEITRMYEDVRELGWKPDYFSFKTLIRVSKKLLTGKAFH